MSVAQVFEEVQKPGRFILAEDSADLPRGGSQTESNVILRALGDTLDLIETNHSSATNLPFSLWTLWSVNMSSMNA